MAGLTDMESQIDPWHIEGMTDQAPKYPKRPRDPAQLAKLIVDIATGEVEEADNPDEGKDPAAVALGRRGGKVGGRARADSMSAEERADAARLAASARWRKRD